MASLIVRDVADSDIERLSALASRVGMSREAYLRQLIERESRRGVMPTAYMLKVSESTELHQTSGRIVRHEDGSLNAFVYNPTVDQNRAFQLATELVRRNAPGDRERAIAYLQSTFTDVYEYPPEPSQPGVEHHELGYAFKHNEQQYLVRVDGSLWQQPDQNAPWQRVALPEDFAEAIYDGFKRMTAEIRRLRLEIADLEQRREH